MAYIHNRDTTNKNNRPSRYDLYIRMGNTAVLGAYAALSGELDIDNIKSSISERFKGEIGQKNAEAAQKGYDFALALKK